MAAIPAVPAASVAALRRLAGLVRPAGGPRWACPRPRRHGLFGQSGAPDQDPAIRVEGPVLVAQEVDGDVGGTSLREADVEEPVAFVAVPSISHQFSLRIDGAVCLDDD